MGAQLKEEARFFKSVKGNKCIPGRRNSTSLKVHVVEKWPLPQWKHSMPRGEGDRRINKDKSGIISTIPAYDKSYMLF